MNIVTSVLYFFFNILKLKRCTAKSEICPQFIPITFQTASVGLESTQILSLQFLQYRSMNDPHIVALIDYTTVQYILYFLQYPELPSKSSFFMEVFVVRLFPTWSTCCLQKMIEGSRISMGAIVSKAHFERATNLLQEYFPNNPRCATTKDGNQSGSTFSVKRQ